MFISPTYILAMLINKIHALCLSGCDLEMYKSLSTFCREISVVKAKIFLNKKKKCIGTKRIFRKRVLKPAQSDWQELKEFFVLEV